MKHLRPSPVIVRLGGRRTRLNLRPPVKVQNTTAFCSHFVLKLHDDVKTGLCS